MEIHNFKGVVCERKTCSETIAKVSITKRSSVKNISKILKEINNNEYLRELNFDCGKIPKKHLSIIADYLSHNKSIITLRFKGAGISCNNIMYLEELFKSNRIIIHLDLSCNSIGKVGVEFLSKYLTANKSMKSLNLTANKIDDYSIKILSNCIKYNNIENINLCTNSIGMIGAIYLLNKLKYKNIRSLDLSGNNIKKSTKNNLNSTWAEHIANFISLSKDIEHLNIQGTFIGDNGARILAESLKINKSLKSLNISCTYISDIGISIILQSLKNNRNIKKFITNHNEFGLKSSQLLSEVFEKNKALSVLSLGWSSIKDNHVKIFIDNLSKNTTIKSLSLFGNFLSNTNYLNSLILKNKSIKHLNLGGNNIHPSRWSKIINCLEKNLSLISLKGVRYLYSSSDKKPINSTLTRNKKMIKSFNIATALMLNSKNVPIPKELQYHILKFLYPRKDLDMKYAIKHIEEWMKCEIDKCRDGGKASSVRNKFYSI